MAVVGSDGERVLRWDVLGDVVKARREAMRLPQDLTSRGGPGEITTRKVERGDGATVQPRTRARLEKSLSWGEGAVDRILTDTATDEDRDPNVRFGAVTTDLGGLLTATAGGASGLTAEDRDADRGRSAGTGQFQARRTQGQFRPAPSPERDPGGSVSAPVDDPQRWAVWGPIPLSSAISAVGTSMALLANVDHQPVAVTRARELIREAFNLLLDEDLRQRQEGAGQ